MKTTDWFPAGTKPVHVGVYECVTDDPDDGQTFQHWDGMCWGYCSYTVDAAMTATEGGLSIEQAPVWRGLTTPTK